MADPLEVQIWQAVRALAGAAAQTHVPGPQQYVRPTLDYSPDRDRVPAIVVAPTPGRTVTRVKKLGWKEVTYPVTAALIDAQGGTAGVGPAWRSGWADALADALHGPTLAGVPAARRVAPDTQIVVDTAAWGDAAVWRALVSVLVTCRLPLRS